MTKIVLMTITHLWELRILLIMLAIGLMIIGMMMMEMAVLVLLMLMMLLLMLMTQLWDCVGVPAAFPQQAD